MTDSSSATIMLATNNAHKLVEIRAIFSHLPITWRTLSSLREPVDVVEDGETFEANALKKAEEIHAICGIPTIADDSGLEVDALDGQPGVYSSRFGGDKGNDRKNNDKLIRLLTDIPAEKRTARFRCVAAFTDGDTRITREGAVEGHIILQSRGSSGFGYDPLFIPVGFTQTFAELGPEIKNTLSHRARAFQAMAEFLHTYYNWK